ncbi:hypothetical protein CKAN_01795100 [Cinnamomum micranthum f. kanehirae]|uniref:Uncharacterized protein n=1 Tax=Cinnamomum micranthum f. kanehirae TaxID=337451 RepID=A0A443PDQ9_9MAGN|nr:hypothetical protein CKAN_01795100 [Cinnamomum micranthum f. kanehirae]
MLSAAPFSSPPSSSTTTPICRPHALAVLPVVSAKIPNSRRNDDHVPQDQQMGGLGFSTLSTLKSSSSKSYTPHHKQQQQQQQQQQKKSSSRSIEEKGPSSSPLSGSDVLLALQRAAADKARSKKGKKGKPRMGGVEQRPSPTTAIADYSDVRPLNIRRDWGDRLDEMERLLQELQMEDEAHRY